MDAAADAWFNSTAAHVISSLDTSRSLELTTLASTPIQRPPISSTSSFDSILAGYLNVNQKTCSGLDDITAPYDGTDSDSETVVSLMTSQQQMENARILQQQEEIMRKQRELETLYRNGDFSTSAKSIGMGDLLDSAQHPALVSLPIMCDATTQTDVAEAEQQTEYALPPKQADGSSVEFLDSLRWLLRIGHPCLARHGSKTKSSDFYVTDPIALGNLWREHRGRQHKSEEDGRSHSARPRWTSGISGLTWHRRQHLSFSPVLLCPQGQAYLLQKEN